VRRRQITINMTTLRRILGISLLFALVLTLSGCRHHRKGYKWSRSYWSLRHVSLLKPRPKPNTFQNSGNVSQYRSASPDSFSAQQNAAREANMRAGQQLQQQHQMNSYRRGYTDKLPY
jgi:hypothetical protein